MQEAKKLSYREQLVKLSHEALEAEDYVTLKKIRLKILEYDKAHPSPKQKSLSLEELLHQNHINTH